MKKAAIVFLATLLTACASSHQENHALEDSNLSPSVPYDTHEVYQTDNANTDVDTAVSPCPCYQEASTPCRCAYQPDPCREVLHPRLSAAPAVAEQPRRHCPPDEQTLDCGCGNCRTFEQPENYQPLSDTLSQPDISSEQTAVVDNLAMPEIYILASNRTLNRFLKDTAEIYGKEPDIKIFIKDTVPLSKDLPDGLDKGTENFKARLRNTHTFILSDTLSDADYYVETVADWLDTPSKTIPAIRYTTTLFDKDGNKINEWVEVLKKAENTQNWL